MAGGLLTCSGLGRGSCNCKQLLHDADADADAASRSCVGAEMEMKSEQLARV